MTYQLLVSCMNQADMSLIEDSNIQCNAVVVNQCDKESTETLYLKSKDGKEYCVLWINTKERGLSKSRNMAIKNATADVCMIADDDQLFDNDIEKRVLAEYAIQPNSDVLVFGARYKKKQISEQIKELGFVDLLRVSSVQITFKRESIINNIQFDTKLGAGTPNGAGEENKFLLDCRNNGLKINFTPQTLFKMREGNASTWLHGFNEDFFYKRGMVARYTYGFWFCVPYIPYYIVSHRRRLDCSLWSALSSSVKGFLENKLA